MKLNKTDKITELNKLSDKISLLENRGLHSVTIKEIETLSQNCAAAFKDLSIAKNKHLHRNIVQVYTRVASFLSSWLAEQRNKVTIELLLCLAMQKNNIQEILLLSGFSGNEHLMAMLASDIVDGEKSFANGGLILSLALLNLDQITEEMLQVAISLSDEVKVPLFMGWLNQVSTFTAQGEKNRETVIRHADFLTKVTPDYQMIQCFINAWMLCSYAVFPAKHTLKKYLNQMVRNFLIAEGMSDNGTQYQLNARPKMVVVHERFKPGHAMHRCYAPYIEQLAEYFDLVFIGEKEHIDASYSMAQKTIVLDTNEQSLTDITKIIKAENADIIFYPSLGMSHYTICLANLRLAPVQIMAGGHPATSFSSCIDYIFLFFLEELTSKLVSEKIVTVDNIVFKQEPHPKLKLSTISREYPQGNKFKIAINATSMKINGDFIEACKSISGSAKKKVEYHFFPALTGNAYDSFTRLIENELPGSVVHQSSGYSRFLEALSKCDMSIVPFPFGNTNSTIDALMLHMPVVSMSSAEIAGLTDKAILRTVGLEHCTVVDSVQAYIEKCVQIVNNQAEYEYVHDQVVAIDAKNSLIRKAGEQDDCFSQFARMFALTYDYHLQIQASPARVIDYKNISGARLYRDSL
ncbi:tetratricopeptide repeat protein [Rheinheimera mangrovi]|uniref:hypothetical protein n=1 Tax=Rheinheimera mangrovi TaxID=2498451 RepID=UPI000F8E0E33|nr:hypothetical protein [Rheinheimera mangrovi]